MTVADQRATQKLLTAALNILKGFYAKKAAAALLQTNQPAGPPPPPGFDAYTGETIKGLRIHDWVEPRWFAFRYCECHGTRPVMVLGETGLRHDGLHFGIANFTIHEWSWFWESHDGHFTMTRYAIACVHD